MRILVYGINYSPELVGIGKYTSELCEWLAGQGDQVTVITGMPYYPNWKIHPPYKNRFWQNEIVNQVTVLRSPLFVPERVTGMSRIVHEFSFLATSFISWTPRLFRRFDVVFIVAPPLSLGIVGLIYRLLHKATFVYHIQDLQLDAARELGLIKNKLLLGIVGWMEKRILRGADYVSTISEGMKRKIVAKGISADKLVELRNWIDTGSLRPAEHDLAMKQALGVDPAKRIVLYSGNLGEKQGLDMIVEVAGRMQDTDVTFLIIGEGAFKKQLEFLIKSKSLSNILLRPLQPATQLGKVLNLATLHLVLQRNAAADLVMPSKLTGILSVGGCALVTAAPGTDLFNMISGNGIGLVVEPENLDALEAGIRGALNSDLGPMRERARRFAQDHLERDAVIGGFRSFLLSRIRA